MGVGLGVVALALLGSVFAPAALAQSQANQPAPTVQLEDQRDVSLSPQQMLEKAEEYLPFMEAAARSVRQRLVDARKARDVVKVLCLNDKLNQIDVAVRTASDRLGLLRAAVQRNDGDASKHEFTVLRVLRDRVNTLVVEANQCIGEEAAYIEESRVTVEIDPSVPDVDPTEPPDGLISDPPVSFSPTM